jgi:hypothetical protein
MSKRFNAVTRLPAYLVIAFILAAGISACKDDPVTPKPDGKDSCDTCIDCDTCCDTCTIDTTDTTVISPGDPTSHDFTWTEYSVPNEASITGSWVFSDTAIWVVSNNLYRLRGSEWKQVAEFNSGTSVFAFTENDAWFTYYEIIWRWRNGKREEIRLENAPYKLWDPATDGAFRAAWGTSSNDMFFVGDKGTIVHFDGTNWMKFPKVTQRHIRSVWGTASNDVWACGWDETTALSVLLHYDGSNWKEIDVLTLGDIRAGRHGLLNIWSCDSAGHKIVVGSGSLVWRKTDEGNWRQDSADLKNELGGGGASPIGIRGNGANDLLAAGGYGYISHWNGKSWHRYDQFWQPGSNLYGANTLSIKGNTAVVAGSKNGSWIAVGRRAK